MHVQQNLKLTTNIQDTDGCPDSVDAIDSTYTFPDADGDGIDDRWDACIDEPENYNNYLDMTVAQMFQVQNQLILFMLILTVMDIQMLLILVQQVQKLGINI